MASLRKSQRLISSRGHGCFTISPPQLPAAATRFPSHGSCRPGLELRTATKLSSVGFEPTAVLTFDLRVRRLNHSATRSLMQLIFCRTPVLFYLYVASLLVVNLIQLKGRKIKISKKVLVLLYSIKSLLDELPIKLPTNYSSKHFKDDNTMESNRL